MVLKCIWPWLPLCLCMCSCMYVLMDLCVHVQVYVDGRD